MTMQSTSQPATTDRLVVVRRPRPRLDEWLRKADEVLDMVLVGVGN